VISRYVHQWGEIVADVLAHPVFAAKEVARERSLALEQLRSLRDEDEKLAAYFYEQFLFPGHPISRLTVGNLNTVSHLTAADCKQFHEAHFRKENMFVVVAGSIDEDGAKQLVQKLTCDISDGRTLRPAREVPKPAKKRRILLVDKPDRTQSYVVMGHLSLDIFDSDLYGMIVGNAAFGGSDTARLFHEIRDVRGWSYFAYSTLYAGPEFGTVRIEFAPPTDKTVQAIELVLHMMRQVAQNGLTDEEIEFFKAHLANEFPLSIETVSDLAWRKFSCEIDSLPFEYCERYPENIKAVDNQTVNKALARWFKPQEATIVVVCSASDIEHELRATFPDDEITIIPYTTIELTR
jgi:zinc protease